MRYGRGDDPKIKKLFRFIVFILPCILSVFGIVILLVVHWLGDSAIAYIKSLNAGGILSTVGIMCWWIFVGCFFLYYIIGILGALAVWIQEILSFIIFLFQYLFSKRK